MHLVYSRFSYTSNVSTDLTGILHIPNDNHSPISISTITYMLPSSPHASARPSLTRLPQNPRSVNWFRSVATRNRFLISESHTGASGGLRWPGPASVALLYLDTVGSVVVTPRDRAVPIGLRGKVECHLSSVHDVLALHLNLLPLSLRGVVGLPHPLLVTVAPAIVGLQAASPSLPGLFSRLYHF